MNTIERSAMSWSMQIRDPSLSPAMDEKRFKTALEKNRLDGLVASSPKTVAYVSNFDCLSHHFVEMAVCLAILPGDNSHAKTLVIPFWEIDQYFESKGWKGKVRAYEQFYVFVSNEELSFYEQKVKEFKETSPSHPSPIDAVVAAINDGGLNASRVGIETKYLKSSFIKELEARLPTCTFIEADCVWRWITSVKSSMEVELLRQAASINQEAMRSTTSIIKEGVIEEDLADHFKQKVIGLGGTPTFAVIKSGPESSLVHMPPSKYMLKRGDLVRFDAGCTYSRYHADLARTYVVGKATDRQKQTYHALIAGQQTAFDNIRPGVSVGDLFKITVETVRANGIPHYQRGFIGHGIGTELYDAPMVTPGETLVFEPGMCMNIEIPYYELGFGGFNIEDLVCVTRDGCKVLSTLDRKLEIQ